MFLKIIEEIRKCLDNDLYTAALALSLTIPDICGNIEYPKISLSATKYKKWYREWIGKYEISSESFDEGIPYESADVIYSLRCNMLHSGNIDIEKKCGIDNFELLTVPKNSCSCNTSCREIEWYSDDKGRKIICSRSLTINVRILCEKLCAAATKFYYDNQEKFALENKFVDIDRRTRRIFLKKL